MYSVSMSALDVLLGDALLAAAYQAFARHGFKRTTMGDIAEAAGMSRPALYLRVSNKEEALRLVADALLAQSLGAARAAADGPGDLADRAEAVLLAKLELTLGLAARSEHAAELLEQYHRLVPEGAEAYFERLAVILAGVLAGSGAADARCATLAEALICTVLGLEIDLGRPDRARRLLHEMTQAVTAGLPVR
jgi:TetR/AcrR family transcriptional regulator